MVRITLDSEIVQFSSKLNVNPDNWDTKRGKVIGKTVYFNREVPHLSIEKYTT